jgi:hypothetical protein
MNTQRYFYRALNIPRKDNDWYSPVETPDGRKIGYQVGNVTYLRNDIWARFMRFIRRIK